jgi:hypothetical protein
VADEGALGSVGRPRPRRARQGREDFRAGKKAALGLPRRAGDEGHAGKANPALVNGCWSKNYRRIE